MSSRENRAGAARVALPFGVPEELAAANPKFWSRVRVDVDTGCWVWTGPLNQDGYGKHRRAYQHARGEIPDGKYVLHTCHNRACVNPAHLRLGTQSDNIKMSVADGRWPKRRRRLTASDVAEMRRLKREDGVGYMAIAKRFGVSHGHARNVLNGNKWGRTMGGDAA